MTLTSDSVVSILGAIGILFGVFVSLYTVYSTASKTGFEQLERVVQALQKTVETQGQEIDKLRQENHDLQEWAEDLVAQIKKAGLIPVPFRRSKTRPVKDER